MAKTMEPVNVNEVSRISAGTIIKGEITTPTDLRVDKKVGRNDPCPCGSGLKYKNCHGKGIA